MKAKIRSTLQSLSEGKSADIKVSLLRAAFEYAGAQISKKHGGLEITLPCGTTLFSPFKPTNSSFCAAPTDFRVISLVKSTLKID